MSSNRNHDATNNCSISEKDRAKKLHQLTKQMGTLEGVIDRKQKLLAQKRKDVPGACKELLLDEKMALVEHFFEASIKPEKPTSIDISKIIEDVENRTNNCRLESDNETRLREKIQETHQRRAILEEDIQWIVIDLLSEDF